MSPFSAVLALLIGLNAARAGCSAQEAPPDSVPSYDTLTISSLALGEVRRINVHTPRIYTARIATRFPVLY